jgi:transcriptional regulator with XRE-family HTH domain
MIYQVRELRDSTGLTQAAFAKKYGIPLSTLRKWEQGEASPPSYVLALLAGTLPAMDSSLKKYQGNSGKEYYYDPVGKRVFDAIGNSITIMEDLDGVKEQNLVLYLEDMFEGLYQLQEKFEMDCKFDKQEDILWIR